MNKYEKERLHECYPICDVEVTTVNTTHGQSHCDNTSPCYTACDSSVPSLITGLGTGSVVGCHAGGLSIFLSVPVLTVSFTKSVKQHSPEINRSAPQYKRTGFEVSYDGHKNLQIQTSAGQLLFILTGFRVPTLSGNQGKAGKSFSFLVKKSGNSLKNSQR